LYSTKAIGEKKAKLLSRKGAHCYDCINCFSKFKEKNFPSFPRFCGGLQLEKNDFHQIL